MVFALGNGELDRDEMRTVLESCTEESSLSMDQQQLEELTDVMFEESDTEIKDLLHLMNYAVSWINFQELLKISQSGIHCKANWS